MNKESGSIIHWLMTLIVSSLSQNELNKDPATTKPGSITVNSAG